MKTGIFTMIYNDRPLERVLRLVSRLGYEAIEINAWKTYVPGRESLNSRHIDVDHVLKNARNAEEFTKSFKKYNLTISALTDHESAWYTLNSDSKIALRAMNRMKRLVDTAEALEVPTIVGFSGGDHWGAWYCDPPPLRTEWNRQWDSFGHVWGDLIDYFADRGITFSVEPHPGNLVYSPETYEKAAKELNGKKEFGLNYDPSHFVWQGIDVNIPIMEFKDRIYHVHAKDTEILKDQKNRTGVLSKSSWRFRTPGFGNIDWKRLLVTLRQSGYDGSVSLECEDQTMSRENAVKHYVQFIKPLIA